MRFFGDGVRSSSLGAQRRADSHGVAAEFICQGEVEREETLVVKIPVGVEEGMALRVPGRGAASRVEGGAPGDLYVVVYSAPDPRFERRGPHLWRAETIEIPDAVLGTRLEAPALDGLVTAVVPPGTQPETVLRLRGKGLPELESERRGDLFLVILVHVSEKLSKAEREIYGRLRAAPVQRGSQKP